MAMEVHPYHSGRKIVTRSKISYKSLSKSNKTGYVQGHESRTQHKWSLVFDRDPSIAEYYEEPSSFDVITEEGSWEYFPDFMIYWASGEIEYIEIKPLRQLDKPGVREHLEATGAFITRQGFGFRILTEKDLPYTDEGLSNLRRLKWWYDNHPTPADELKQLVPSSPTTFGALSQQLGDGQLVMEMIALDLLRFDMNQALCPETVLSTAEVATNG